MLDESIAILKGIGQARVKAFERLGVNTLRDILFYLPRDYQDYSNCKKVCELRHGELAALKLTADEPKLYYPYRGMSIVSAAARDDTGRVELIWFNQPYRKNAAISDRERVFCGRVDTSRALRLVNPSIADEPPGIVPIYTLSHGLNQRHITGAVKQALRLCTVEETLPKALLEQYSLCSLIDALNGVHLPNSMEELTSAKHRLAFEDMLYYLLSIAIIKRERSEKPGIAFIPDDACERFMSGLPFSLTNAQKRVLKEIEHDMSLDRPMNRLVQGDVGSGKTVLAFFAMYLAANNGYQAVLMAPTELVARQHYALLYAAYKDKAVLLYGGMKKKEKERAYQAISEGNALYIVGTHALLQPALKFSRLGLVVTDEQHRFGVRQRAHLANKAGIVPDVLIMSATPIPRTLAMLLYGDLDVSVVDELPPGRRPVMTRLVPDEKREDMYNFIVGRIGEGRQAYVVCPLIEQSDVLDVKNAQDVHKELVAAYPHIRFGLMHGRLVSAKKDELIEAFRRKEIDVLVSTTVVEVGVDVPNATVMVIENADRFGLAQLHQLRGRVGRGAMQSFCFLLGGSSQSAMNRLSALTKTNDGFEIARKDLELRGPGEFLGTRQHGNDGLYAAKMAANMDVLLLAQLAADRLMGMGESAENVKIFSRAKQIFEDRMSEIANN